MCYLQEDLTCPFIEQKSKGRLLKDLPHTAVGPQPCFPIYGHVCHVLEIHRFGAILAPRDGPATDGEFSCKGNNSKLVY